MKRLLQIILFLAVATMMSGCGQMGPLYLPDHPNIQYNGS